MTVPRDEYDDAAFAVTLDIDRRTVPVPVPDGSHVLVDVQRRRSRVVRRLLELGVTTTTLCVLLPEWERLIRTVDASMHAIGPDGEGCSGERPPRGSP